MSKQIVTPGLQRSPIYRVRGLTDKLYPDADVTPEQATVLSNVNLTEQGSAKTRNGYTTYNSNQMTGGKGVTGLYQATFKTNGVQQIEVGNTGVYADNGTTRKDITGALTLTNSEDSRYRFAFIKDQIVATNGVDETWTWGGDYATPTAAAALAGVTWSTCQDIVSHRNLLFCLYPTESAVKYPTRIRWCDIDIGTFQIDITSWPTDSYYELYQDGSAIVGGVDAFDRLMVFKADGMYPVSVVIDEGFIEVVAETPRRGFEPIAKNSIIARPEFIWVVARDGCYRINPDLSFELVTSPIQSTWNALNQGRLQYAVSWMREQDHQVRTLLSGSTNTTYHDKVLVYDWQTGDVWIDTPTDTLNYATRFVSSNTEYDFLGTGDGYVMTGNTGTQDNGTGFSWTITLSPNDLGLPGKLKRIVNLLTYYREQTGSQSITLTLTRDQGRRTQRVNNLETGLRDLWNAGDLWGDGSLWDVGDNNVNRYFVNRVCETVAPSWTGTDEIMDLQGYQVEFVVEE